LEFDNPIGEESEEGGGGVVFQAAAIPVWMQDEDIPVVDRFGLPDLAVVQEGAIVGVQVFNPYLVATSEELAVAPGHLAAEKGDVTIRVAAQDKGEMIHDHFRLRLRRRGCAIMDVQLSINQGYRQERR